MFQRARVPPLRLSFLAFGYFLRTYLVGGLLEPLDPQIPCLSGSPSFPVSLAERSPEHSWEVLYKEFT